MKTKPDCYKCKHRRPLPGDAHIRCANSSAEVKGNTRGIKSGWFIWPFNFDPVWLEECSGYSPEKNK